MRKVQVGNCSGKRGEDNYSGPKSNEHTCVNIHFQCTCVSIHYNIFRDLPNPPPS